MRTLRAYKALLLTFIISALLLVKLPTLHAEENPPADPLPAPQIEPHLGPPALDNDLIFNNLLAPPPLSSLEDDVTDGGRKQEAPGRGVQQSATMVAVGATLLSSGIVCNDFNQENNWVASALNMRSNRYAGWMPFAVDHGLYQAKPVLFTMEQVVGPGQHYGTNQLAAKIASNQPYAGGFGSPLIKVPPEAEVTVSVKYLIWDHDHRGLDYDWASLGVKPDAEGAAAVYVNGYVRGVWRELSYSLKAGPSGKMMVLLQGSSPAAVNSNIYFDDVQILVNGQYLADCLYESSQ
ncbi:MAG: hypothetical protein R3E79_46005 [Caldilineaceae bacterium]